MGSQHSVNGFRLELFGLPCVRKLLFLLLLRSNVGYMLGVAIGNPMLLVDLIDRDGLILKVSSKSLDF